VKRPAFNFPNDILRYGSVSREAEAEAEAEAADGADEEEAKSAAFQLRAGRRTKRERKAGQRLIHSINTFARWD
jgi:hypothetical protein